MPKNIVLLSDGTGNSAGKLLKTNVWRVYEALDLDDPSEQVACYDDGVGTSSLKPLALLGGAFGVGLMKNVLRLYRFLCEHYDPGDRIYAFGFSRGAFTIRVLIGLVCSQGIIRTRPTSPVAESYPSGDPGAAARAAYAIGDTIVRTEPQVFGKELARLSRWAYREFRRSEFTQARLLVTPARKLRDLVFRWLERGTPRYDARDNHHVEEITFLGLWDTVDAYGLPIDELTDGINDWVWPLYAPDFELSQKVKKACHVLAVDDERNTFHPVLWDESKERQDATHVDDERISQVWFAGMHANVGGGYADDALSYLSLRWITTEAAKRDLRFVPALLNHHTAKADPFGRIYDSRSGLKGYYRYNPRKIEWLSNGQVHEAGFGGWPKPSPTVTIARPKIHESVFARIAAAPEAYAPIIFPARYAIVRENGAIIDGAGNPYEDSDAGERRVRAQESVWNLVWWRRMLYFLMLAVSAVLVVRPLGETVPPLAAADHTAASQVISVVGDNLPAFADPWIIYYSARPSELAVLLGIILVLMRISAAMQASICSRMRNIWSQVIPPPTREVDKLQEPSDLLYKIRLHPYYQGTSAVVRRLVLPTVFGVGMLVVLMLCALGAANRTLFEAANGLGAFCRSSSAAPATPLPVGGSKRIDYFRSSEACQATAVHLEEGARYVVELALPGASAWRDDSIRVDSPGGFTSMSAGFTLPQRLVFTAFAPFRRMWGADWFVPIARIGERGFDQYPLRQVKNAFTARSSGEVFLFVNDAIAPVGVSPFQVSWKSYYGNNRGVASVTFTRMRAAGSRP